MTRDFSNKFRSASRDTTLTELASLKDKNSSMHTETCAFKWAWLLPITTRKCGRLFNKLTRTEMEKSTNKK